MAGIVSDMVVDYMNLLNACVRHVCATVDLSPVKLAKVLLDISAIM